MKEPKPVEDESPAALRAEAAHARRLASACPDDLLRAKLRTIAEELTPGRMRWKGLTMVRDPQGVTGCGANVEKKRATHQEP